MKYFLCSFWGLFMFLFFFLSSSSSSSSFVLTSYLTAPRVISSCMDNVELEVGDEEGSMWSGGN